MATIFEDNFNSYTDGDLNGQGGWSGDVVFDIQGVTVKEGAKAVSCAGTGLPNNIIKVGTSVATGTITVFMRRSVINDGYSAFILHEGITSVLAVILWDTGHIQNYNGTDWYDIYSPGTYVVNQWYQIQIEWRISDKKFRFNVDNGGWSAWDYGYQGATGWAVGIDKVRLTVYGQTIATSYWDYIAEYPYSPPVAGRSQGLIF